MNRIFAAGSQNNTASLPLLIVAATVFVLLVVGYFVLQHRLKKNIGRKLAAFATERGWEYDHNADGLERRYLWYPFGGPVPEANFAFRGVHRGREFVSFQYSYTNRWDDEEGNAQTRTHYFHVTGVLTPAPRPTLQVNMTDWAERLDSKFGGALGVDFRSSNPEFNSRFQVAAEDTGFARAVIEPQLAAWAPYEEKLQWLPFRFERQDLLTWSQWSAPEDAGGWLAGFIRSWAPDQASWFDLNPAKLDPESIVPMLDLLCDVLDRTPAEVWR